MMDKVSYVVFNGKKWLRGIHWAKLIGKAGQKRIVTGKQIGRAHV